MRRFGFLVAAIAAGFSVLGGAGLASVAGFRAYVKPVLGAHISQPFGCTTLAIEPYDPACRTQHFHSGIDLAAPRGTPVRATLGGTCQVIDTPTGYGLHVIIDHGNGLSSLYAHLEAATVHTGEWVFAGEEIGLVGMTGNATGPHLHFEIRVDGVPQNPQLFLQLP